MKSLYKIIMLILWTIIVQSCDIQKQAVKTKTAQVEVKDQTQTTNQKSTDYTKTNHLTDDLYFEPINPLLSMQIVTSKGDTIKATNTKISNRKSQTDTYNNKKEETQTKAEDNTVTNTDVKAKASNKEENFDSSIVLYIVGGVVLLMVLTAGLMLFLMYRIAKKNKAELAEVLQKIS